MKTVVLMFDSLNRHLLPGYNPGTFVQASNFKRLAERAATFDRSYVCSMPCMPARRDFHTGRPNFLHRGWGPIEPFDDSVPQILRDAGVHTHLCSDHYHYWEDGGATYHTRYSTWEAFRGQEGDPWIGQVAPPDVPANLNGKGRDQDWINRPHMTPDAYHSQTRTLDAGMRYIDRNAAQDNWMLQIECFDPHEPFFSGDEWLARYPTDYDGPLFDWPAYREVTETPEQVAEARRRYAALMTKCDQSLGRVLDAFDRHNLWDDTMLVVWTDHGFMLGEHDCWAKSWMPLYEEVSHTPLFVFDPRYPESAGQRRGALVQPAIDLGPTLLRCFGQEPTADMLGHDLTDVIVSDTPVRDAAIFGYNNNRINLTDGRYAYYRAPRDSGPGNANQYTLMTMEMRGYTSRLENATLAGPLSFTKGMPVLRIPLPSYDIPANPADDDLLFDLETDPSQASPLNPAEHGDLLAHLETRMAELMHRYDAPDEQYRRMGLTVPR